MRASISMRIRAFGTSPRSGVAGVSSGGAEDQDGGRHRELLNESMRHCSAPDPPLEDEWLHVYHSVMNNTTARPSDPDWALLRAFLSVAHNGSLTRAAQELGSSQPTL